MIMHATPDQNLSQIAPDNVCGGPLPPEALGCRRPPTLYVQVGLPWFCQDDDQACSPTAGQSTCRTDEGHQSRSDMTQRAKVGRRLISKF